MNDVLVQPPLSLTEGSVVVQELVARARLTESTVLVEIGGNAGRAWAARLGVGAWHSVDPRNAKATDGQVTSWCAWGEDMPLPDDSASVVFSCNAFQFVDFAGVLRDAYRVLRPGGILYSHFGPIWSGPDGHQLEYVQYEGRELRLDRHAAAALCPPTVLARGAAVGAAHRRVEQISPTYSSGMSTQAKRSTACSPRTIWS